MTLLKAILKAQSKSEKYPSPPPETNIILKKKKKFRPTCKTSGKVDSIPPKYDAQRLKRKMPGFVSDAVNLYNENISLVMSIQRAHKKGRVDSHWTKWPPSCRQYYERRLNSYKNIREENAQIYRRLLGTKPRVDETASLNKDWYYNKKTIAHCAQREFILFPLKHTEDIEDPAFAHGVSRPRIHITLGIRNAAAMGSLEVELFTDVCPQTCSLFLDLLDGDGLGYGYVGTRFFRKVPNLFWSGGDVVHNNGFGCYAQKGRHKPIGAENYHFSHSMPGLLSMRVTENDEMCGVFNITFKALPQLDLRNVVFGRVIRPNSTYDNIKNLGSPLSTQPIVEIVATKRMDGKCIYGTRNTKLASFKNQIL
ncbi:unnamed protein product [Pieris macdunnoughi]|uniref:PPIase cyclophilin-type domain-containing protein n=2 Tax=Pieris macdunnoughi TaxID=345717 RepID=A0A821XDE5_9NEOP|nr:unnamed protein product [Pieris macdunnoughi]